MRLHTGRGVIACLLPAVLALSGCDLLATKYEPASMSHALKGMVPSPTDRYRVPMPNFAAYTKNTAIARDGALFAVLVGPDLRGIVEKYPVEGTELGVQLVRADRRYLVVEKVYTKDGEIDLFDGVEKLRFRRPKLVGYDEIPHDKFVQDKGLCEVPPRSHELDEVVNTKVYISEFRVEKREIPTRLVEAVPEVQTAEQKRSVQYFLTSAGSDYIIRDPDPMTRLMLEFLIAEDREFKGGIHVSDIFERGVRTDTRVAGSVNVRWISLGGTLFYRAST